MFCFFFHRLLTAECGTFNQLQYFANNFDDFFVNMFFTFFTWIGKPFYKVYTRPFLPKNLANFISRLCKKKLAYLCNLRFDPHSLLLRAASFLIFMGELETAVVTWAEGKRFHSFFRSPKLPLVLYGNTESVFFPLQRAHLLVSTWSHDI